MNGDIYVVGNFTEYESNTVPGIVKFTKNPIYPYDYQYDSSFDAYVDSLISVNSDDGKIDINTVAVDMTGKVYIGGNFTYDIQGGTYFSYDLVRLNSNGTLDTSFYNVTPGANRGTGSSIGNKIYDIEIVNGPGGERIYVGGSFSSMSLKSGFHANQCLMLINNDGTVNTTFTSNISSASLNCSSGGVVDIEKSILPTTASAYEVIVGGKFSFVSISTKYSLMKYNLSSGVGGVLATFNNNVSMTFSDTVTAIQQVDGGPHSGKIVYSKEMAGPSYSLGMLDYSSASQVTVFNSNFNMTTSSANFGSEIGGAGGGIKGIEQFGGQLVIVGDFMLTGLSRSMATVNLEGMFTGGDFGFMESSGNSIDFQKSVLKILPLSYPNSPKAIFAGNIDQFHNLGGSGSAHRIFGLP
ncbi:MAG: delta-60 repeat domain-containing protein [Bacteriovoracaceae bacterium]|nr:delta-60 repeat domain-containing protein [Bacteriovoracaceae bacterium]